MSLEGTDTIPPVAEGHVGWAIFGDHHQAVVGETTPLTAVPYDEYVATSIRPPALVLASGLINGWANQLLDEYGQKGWQEELAGDLVDASKPHEWSLFLSTHNPELWKKFLPEDSDSFDNNAWSRFFAGAENLFSWSELAKALRQDPSQIRLPLTRPGNHEGRPLGSLLWTKVKKAAIDKLIPKDMWVKLGKEDFLSKEEWIADYLPFRHLNEKTDPEVPRFEHDTRLEITPEHRTGMFNQYWHKKQNGDYVCSVQVTNSDLAEGFEPILLQARCVGIVNHRPIYELVFDTSDMSGSLPKTAATGELSGLQQDLWQLFLDELREQELLPLFVPQGHISLGEQDQANLQDLKWPDFLKKDDIVPVFLCANGHHRDIAFENGLWNIMVPSVLDADNEFMTVDLSYDESTEEYVITQEYKKVIPETMVADAEVRASVNEFETELSHRHYATYSELSSRPVPTAWNIFLRKEVLTRDSDLVQLQSMREDLRYAQKYLEFLKLDTSVSPGFVRLVEYHSVSLSTAVANLKLRAPTSEALKHAQALQFYISQTPQGSKAAQFMYLLGLTAAEQEGQRGEVRGLIERPAESVPDRNVFRWNPKTGVIVRVSSSL